MEKYIDLHTHSIYSDGSMTPTKLVHHAKKNGIYAIALTDHDCVKGVDEAVSEGKKIGIEVVPGIEFSVMSKTETHILGYFIDIKSAALQTVLPEILQVRYERGKHTEENLKKQGFDVTYEMALEFAPGGLVGRAHFAKVMVKKGYCSSVKEAFDVY